MKNRITKKVVTAAILSFLIMALVCTSAFAAASYSKVYGQTQDKVRVRESASTNAAIIDNIVKNACVYVTSSKTSGSSTFVQVKYRASNGDVVTGWVCQNDGKDTYVKILSADQAKKEFSRSSWCMYSKAYRLASGQRIATRPAKVAPMPSMRKARGSSLVRW